MGLVIQWKNNGFVLNEHETSHIVEEQWLCVHLSETSMGLVIQWKNNGFVLNEHETSHIVEEQWFCVHLS